MDLAIGFYLTFLGWGTGFGLTSVVTGESPNKSSYSSTGLVAYCLAGFGAFSIHFFIISFEKLLINKYQKWVLGYLACSGSSGIIWIITS